MWTAPCIFHVQISAPSHKWALTNSTINKVHLSFITASVYELWHYNSEPDKDINQQNQPIWIPKQKTKETNKKDEIEAYPDKIKKKKALTTLVMKSLMYIKVLSFVFFSCVCVNTSVGSTGPRGGHTVATISVDSLTWMLYRDEVVLIPWYIIFTCNP